LKNELYVLRDLIAECSGPIFEARNNGVAIRKYNELLKDNPYPAEYDLIHIGTINHETEKLTALDPTPVELTINTETEETEE